MTEMHGTGVKIIVSVYLHSSNQAVISLNIFQIQK